MCQDKGECHLSSKGGAVKGEDKIHKSRLTLFLISWSSRKKIRAEKN